MRASQPQDFDGLTLAGVGPLAFQGLSRGDGLLMPAHDSHGCGPAEASHVGWGSRLSQRYGAGDVGADRPGGALDAIDPDGVGRRRVAALGFQ